eukprot:superscaffoldBa00005406_g20297
MTAAIPPIPPPQRLQTAAEDVNLINMIVDAYHQGRPQHSGSPELFAFTAQQQQQQGTSRVKGQTPGLPALKEPPICRTSAAGPYLVIRDRPLGRPATDRAHTRLSLGPPGFISGDPRQGRDPVLVTLREKKPHHRYLWGADQGGGVEVSGEPLASLCS